MCYFQLHLQLWSFPLDDVNQRPVQKSGVESCFSSIKSGLNPPEAEIVLGCLRGSPLKRGTSLQGAYNSRGARFGIT